MQPSKQPRFLVAHSKTITMEALMDELKAEPAEMEEDYQEMASRASDCRPVLMMRRWTWQLLVQCLCTWTASSCIGHTLSIVLMCD